MKKYLLIALALVTTSAYACTIYSINTPDGRQVWCTKCCDANGYCNIQCN